MAIVTRIVIQRLNMPAVSLALGEELHVAPGVGIFATGAAASPGVLAYGNNVMSILGVIFSTQNHGITTAGGGNTISIAGGGSVFGLTCGISLFGNVNTITNFGEISSLDGEGVFTPGDSFTLSNAGAILGTDALNLYGNNNIVANSGYLEGRFNGIHFDKINNSVVNTGTIRGGEDGIDFDGVGGLDTVINIGTIVGFGSKGIEGDTGQDIVANNGFIQGTVAAVDLLGGNDIYDGRGGFLSGAVLGGAGADTLYGGAGSDRLEGGTENDHISGGAGSDSLDGGDGFDFARYDFAASGVAVRLDNPALNTGEAAGDIMFNFEGLAGSAFDDILVGGGVSATNHLYGNGGNDVLYGLDGQDFLIGGAGSDGYFGGTGPDVFLVQAGDVLAGQQDRVFDFADGQDRLTFQGVSPAGASLTAFGGGTLLTIPTAGGTFAVFLDAIAPGAAIDQILFT